MDISKLSPFQGLHTSLIYFSEGYTFRISDWTSSPTEYGPFSNLWVVTPDDRRILYANPADSGQVVCIYHNFDQVFGALISIQRPKKTEILLRSQGEDGTQVNLSLQLAETLPTRLSAGMSRSMPVNVASTGAFIWLANILSSKFVAKGNTRVNSVTDTGQSSFACKNEQLYLVKGGNATLNGMDLGNVCPPERNVAFGEFQTTPQAFLMVGSLYLAYQKSW